MDEVDRRSTERLTLNSPEVKDEVARWSRHPKECALEFLVLKRKCDRLATMMSEIQEFKYLP